MLLVFFFNDTATTEIYTLSLHDALPISMLSQIVMFRSRTVRKVVSDFSPSGVAPTKTTMRAALLAARRSVPPAERQRRDTARSEEHTSELQSRQYLVCRLLLEKKKNTIA